MQIKSYLRTYSFRSAILIFLAFGLTLIAVRLSIYAQSLRTAYGDLVLVVTAHAEELGENIERYGPAYTNNLVNAILRDAGDPNLYIGLRSPAGLTGNFPQIEKFTTLEQGWREIVVSNDNNDKPLSLYVHCSSYPDGSRLLVGYDMGYINEIKQALPRSLFENLELAMAISIVLSLLMIWLLNRHVRKFNIVFEKVSSGQLDYRMKARSEIDQFDRLAINLDGMLDWLTTMLEMSRELGNTLAHDLRTPLSRHRLELCAIADSKDLPITLKEKLESSIAKLDELVAMLQNILTISLAESRNTAQLFDEINLSDIVESITSLYEPIAEDKNIDLQTSFPAEAIRITGDRQLLGQAIGNLVDNAIKYTPEGGAVQLELRRHRGGVALEVSDNGPGVPQDMLDKIKQRFIRADSSRHIPGFGIGLSLVEAVAKLHHGSLSVENTPTGFRATLQFGLIKWH